MTRTEAEEILARRPFVPLIVRLLDGTTLDVPFSHVAVPWRDRLMVFQGVEREGSRVATGKAEVTFDRIAGIEPRKPRSSGRRKKAS